MTVDDNASMMGKVTRVGDLYDFYGVLLTERQRQMIELYYLDDLSLAEIAELLTVTRQAVHDNLRRAADQLEAYEAALHLLDTHARQRALVEQLLSVWARIQGHLPNPETASLQKMLDDLAAEYQIETE